MIEWPEKFFIKGADLFLKIMNPRWPIAETEVEGMMKILRKNGIESGNVLDLCCGNGRMSINFAKKGFRATGIDFSISYLEDARKRAEEHGVSSLVNFVEGDARNLKTVLRDDAAQFDAVVNAWTSIGYTTKEDDLSMFKQARGVSKASAILFIIDTMHEGRASLRKEEHSFLYLGDMVLLDHTNYDQITSEQRTTWAFYDKKGKNLDYIDELEYRIHVYSPSELSSLLREAGWRVEAFYGNVSTLQPMSPFTSMNIVAKAE